MTTRERRLAYVILTFIAVAGVAFFGYQFYLAPMKARDQQIANLRNEIDEKELREHKIKLAKKRMEQLSKISLPVTPGIAADAEPAGRTRLANREYVDELTKMLRLSGYEAGTFSITAKQPDAKSVPMLAKNKPAYIRLTYDVDAKGDLASLVDWMGHFYEKRLLHRIKNLTVTRPIGAETGRGRPNELEVKATIEALVLDTAEQRKTLEPEKPVELPPVLARGRDAYASIAGKDLFFGPPDRRAEAPAKPPLDPSPYIKLDGLYADSTGPVATLFDAFHNQDYVIRPRSAGDGFRVEVFYYLGGRKRPLRSGAAIELPDDDGEVLKRWTIVQLNANELVLKDESKHYALRLGHTLGEMTTLTKQELAARGINPEKAGESAAEKEQAQAAKER